MTTDPTPCDASHYHRGGVNCELPMGHAGLHRHGEFDAPVVYWSTPFDLATRAELVAELAATAAFIDPVRLRFYDAGEGESVNAGDVDVRDRITADGRARLSERRAAIVVTLYGGAAVEPVAVTVARMEAEREADGNAEGGYANPRRRRRRSAPAKKAAPKPVGNPLRRTTTGRFTNGQPKRRARK